MGRGHSVAGREKESEEQCKEEGSGNRSGVPRLQLGPLVFEALEKWRNLSLVPVPSPTQPSESDGGRGQFLSLGLQGLALGRCQKFAGYMRQLLLQKGNCT